MGQNNLVLFNTTSYIYILNFCSKEDFLGTFFSPSISLRIAISEPFIAKSSFDGRFIAISMDSVYLYDLKDLEKAIVVPNSENVKHFVFGEDSDDFFFINEKGQIMNYNIRINKNLPLETQKRHPSPITFMTMSKDSKFILTVSENPSIIFVQDRNTGLINKIISGIVFSNVTNGIFHPRRSNIFLLHFLNGALGFYDVKKPMQPIFEIKDLSVTSASFLPNENSSAICTDLNGQVSIIDFEKRNVQVKWSIDFFSDLLSVKELNGGWNVFIASNEKCFYFNQEGLKLSEYSFDSSEKIIHISTLANDIYISEEFSDIVIEKSNLKVSRSLFSTDMQDCSPGEEIQSLDNRFLNSLFLEDNVSKSTIDGTHSEIKKKFHKNQNNVYNKKELHGSNKRISGNNLSIVSIGKENIPLENSTKKISATNMLSKDSFTTIFPNNILSPTKIHEIRPGFKFETPKSSKKILKSFTKRSGKRDFQINEIILENSSEKNIKTPSTTPDIWLKFENNQNTDIKTPTVDRLTLGKHVQNSEADDLMKTSDVSSSSFKSQKSDVFLTKELQSDLKKSDFFSDNMLTFKDMLLESQKGIRQDIQNLHVELIKQFMLQKLEFEKILKFKNKEIKNLKKENRKLAHELNVYRGYH
ncbi:hypothetical protein T552_00260 [Pneumocystis carinii B80]|uniref:Uncharacterized protein n=1 Tax=Pneumocystis carinii (strain B80) TaxID=1408658 RepID=A0A0W4ZTC9_PNEC8|nr:hypothetical protein T552_00260 [Pneumocystis carinii B80]KTW31621.1 hypothetical protein T552_00260 [Pneumocystis carinii B80]